MKTGGGSYTGDIDCPVHGIDQKLECKRRARAFGTLNEWMGDNFALVVRDNRTELLVLLRLADFVGLARPADHPMSAIGGKADLARTCRNVRFFNTIDQKGTCDRSCLLAR
jgi:hypothetical protein